MRTWGHLAQEDVRCVDVDGDVRAGDVVEDRRGEGLGEVAVALAGEGAVEVDVEHGDAALDRVDAERVDRGVDVHGAVELVQLGLECLCELEGDVLALELVPVHAGDDRDAGLVTGSCRLAAEGRGGRALDAVLLDDQVLAHGQLCPEYRLDHALPFLRNVYLRLCVTCC